MVDEEAISDWGHAQQLFGRFSRPVILLVERSRARPLLRQILPTLFDKRTRTGQQTLEQLQSHPDAAACPHPIPVDTRLRDADALGTREHMYGRGMIAYEHAMQWLLDTAPAEQEAA